MESRSSVRFIVGVLVGCLGCATFTFAQVGDSDATQLEKCAKAVAAQMLQEGHKISTTEVRTICAGSIRKTVADDARAVAAQIGRFQLVAAEVSHHSEIPAKNELRREVFRIDTATGDVSRWLDDEYNGNQMQGWLPTTSPGENMLGHP